MDGGEDVSINCASSIVYLALEIGSGVTNCETLLMKEMFLSKTSINLKIVMCLGIIYEVFYVFSIVKTPKLGHEKWGSKAMRDFLEHKNIKNQGRWAL